MTTIKDWLKNENACGFTSGCLCLLFMKHHSQCNRVIHCVLWASCQYKRRHLFAFSSTTFTSSFRTAISFNSAYFWLIWIISINLNLKFSLRKRSSKDAVVTFHWAHNALLARNIAWKYASPRSSMVSFYFLFTSYLYLAKRTLGSTNTPLSSLTNVSSTFPSVQYPQLLKMNPQKRPWLPCSSLKLRFRWLMSLGPFSEPEFTNGLALRLMWLSVYQHLAWALLELLPKLSVIVRLHVFPKSIILPLNIDILTICSTIRCPRVLKKVLVQGGALNDSLLLHFSHRKESLPWPGPTTTHQGQEGSNHRWCYWLRLVPNSSLFHLPSPPWKTCDILIPAIFVQPPKPMDGNSRVEGVVPSLAVTSEVRGWSGFRGKREGASWSLPSPELRAKIKPGKERPRHINASIRAVAPCLPIFLPCPRFSPWNFGDSPVPWHLHLAYPAPVFLIRMDLDRSHNSTPQLRKLTKTIVIKNFLPVFQLANKAFSHQVKPSSQSGISSNHLKLIAKFSVQVSLWSKVRDTRSFLVTTAVLKLYGYSRALCSKLLKMDGLSGSNCSFGTP